jgi:hypothetical protein
LRWQCADSGFFFGNSPATTFGFLAHILAPALPYRPAGARRHELFSH